MNNLIIHPTDFSKCSTVAFEYSIHLAKIFKCDLLLVHSIDSSQLDGYDLSGRSMLDKSAEIEKIAEEKLQELGNAAIEKGVKCRAQLYTGNLTAWLPDMIKKENPIFTVMGTTGAGSVTNKIFGSNTNSIIQTSNSPVLAIPMQAGFVSPKTLILAADLEKMNKKNVAFLHNVISTFDSSLQLVYVIKEGMKRQGNEAIQNVKTMFEAFENSIEPEFRLIEDNDYINGVSEFIQKEKPDIFSIIMSNKNFIEKFFYGSLSEKMIHSSTIPLLVLPQSM